MYKYLLSTSATLILMLSTQTFAQPIDSNTSVELTTEAQSNPNIFLSHKLLTKELVIIDQAVPDKHLFYQNIKPNTDIKEINSQLDGLQQLTALLSQYQNLDSLHIVSHADRGVIYLGNSQVTEKVLREEVNSLAAIDEAVKDNGDVLFYGCNLAAGESGEALLNLIANQANVDVAASDDLTGNSIIGGNWDLEKSTGKIEVNLAVSEIVMNTYQYTLASTFSIIPDPLAAAGAVTEFGGVIQAVRIDYDADGDIDFLAYDGSGDSFFSNDGSGVFTKIAPNVTFKSTNAADRLVADFDNDGDDAQNITKIMVTVYSQL